MSYSTSTTPSGTMQKEPHPLHLDEFELKELSKTIETSASEPSFHRIVGDKPRPQLEKSISVPVDSFVEGVEPHPLNSYLSRPTGRLQTLDIAEQETKPDFWKIAYYGMKFLTKVRNID